MNQKREVETRTAQFEVCSVETGRKQKKRKERVERRLKNNMTEGKFGYNIIEC